MGDMGCFLITLKLSILLGKTMSAADLSNFLRQRAKTMGLSAIAISKKAGISRQTWYRLVNSNVKKARIETLERVAGVLQVDLVELSYLYTKQQKLQEAPLISILHISDDYPFIKIISRPDNALVNKEESFEKQWQLTNKGQSHWINRRLICLDENVNVSPKKANDHHLHLVKNKQGLRPQEHTIHIPIIAPNEKIILSMPFCAPQNPGTMISFWKMINAKGEACFPDDIGLTCQVSVVENSVCFADKTNTLYD
jgi:transcriptional regulator with XRE-family HTH domain